MCAAAKVASSVMQVANLDRSVSYYCDVFSCRVALRERDAVLLLTPDDFQIYMYVQKGASLRNISSIGVHYVMWSADTEEELTRISERLRAYDASTFTQVVGGVTFVDGCDPDGIRVIVAYPDPEQLPRELIAPRFHG
ncbi:VOC family protein (plasmid) [Rhodococcus qingshengii]|jgi:catechol-2,3-dioxygenase|uniref:VOC family protein n=1 Tax=Rhodococcus TaxID=1827 RepID=UPI0007DB341C|nr:MULTISPECIES: VOC family protein [Rhodococcus]AZI65904.1 VOC family protein [Rhodococcus sp. NJ-530]BDQ23871.1 VOC family protein [Rhodococcus qingshengii]